MVSLFMLFPSCFCNVRDKAFSYSYILPAISFIVQVDCLGETRHFLRLTLQKNTSIFVHVATYVAYGIFLAESGILHCLAQLESSEKAGNPIIFLLLLEYGLCYNSTHRQRLLLFLFFVKTVNTYSEAGFGAFCCFLFAIYNFFADLSCGKVEFLYLY
jgi:hypothetical protein